MEGHETRSLVTTVGGLADGAQRRIQFYLDRTTPHVHARWAALAVGIVLVLVRMATYGGFYVVVYALGVYLLNILLLFLSPKFDPSGELFGGADVFADDEADDLPTAAAPLGGGVDAAGEFRPFVRRLPEFRAWLCAARSTSLALVCMLFPAFDIPVFWPILLVYFVLLTAATLRRQIAHMVRHGYVPFDIGKRSYVSA